MLYLFQMKLYVSTLYAALSLCSCWKCVEFPQLNEHYNIVFIFLMSQLRRCTCTCTYMYCRCFQFRLHCKMYMYTVLYIYMLRIRVYMYHVHVYVHVHVRTCTQSICRHRSSVVWWVCGCGCVCTLSVHVHVGVFVYCICVDVGRCVTVCVSVHNPLREWMADKLRTCCWNSAIPLCHSRVHFVIQDESMTVCTISFICHVLDRTLQLLTHSHCLSLSDCCSLSVCPYLTCTVGMSTDVDIMYVHVYT